MPNGVTKNGHSRSDQALLRPESTTRVGGLGRAGEINFLKRGKKKKRKKEKKKKKKEKEKKNSEKQQGAAPAWASLTAFLPGPSPRAATMAKY